jgi:hypothetical protein
VDRIAGSDARPVLKAAVEVFENEGDPMDADDAAAVARLDAK